jgi:hypothetical protein
MQIELHVREGISFIEINIKENLKSKSIMIEALESNNKNPF